MAHKRTSGHSAQLSVDKKEPRELEGTTWSHTLEWVELLPKLHDSARKAPEPCCAGVESPQMWCKGTIKNGWWWCYENGYLHPYPGTKTWMNIRYRPPDVGFQHPSVLASWVSDNGDCILLWPLSHPPCLFALLPFIWSLTTARNWSGRYTKGTAFLAAEHSCSVTLNIFDSTVLTSLGRLVFFYQPIYLFAEAEDCISLCISPSVFVLLAPARHCKNMNSKNNFGLDSRKGYTPKTSCWLLLPSLAKKTGAFSFSPVFPRHCCHFSSFLPPALIFYFPASPGLKLHHCSKQRRV